MEKEMLDHASAGIAPRNTKSRKQTPRNNHSYEAGH